MNFKKAIFSIGLALMFVGCSSSPTSTIESFYDCIKKADIECASEYATQETITLLTMAQGMGGLKANPDLNIEILSEEIDGDYAKVVVSENGKKSEPANLVKIDGDWKVQIKKR